MCELAMSIHVLAANNQIACQAKVTLFLPISFATSLVELLMSSANLVVLN